MIDVVLPVLDEVEAIPRVLASVPPGYRPIVVDNGSRDGSASVARACGALVVDEPTRGFGAACFAGLAAATSDVVCFMDCDGSLDGSDLPRVVALVSSRGGLALGARCPTSIDAWPRHARLGNRLVVEVVARRTGVRVSDLGPMRAAPRAALLELGLLDRRFGWPLEMVVRAARAGWAVHETPVAYRPRIGASKVTGTFRGTVRAARDMLAVLP